MELAPLKRFTTQVYESMYKRSAFHNRQLEELLTVFISGLPDKPVTGLKQLLELYLELLTINRSKVTNEQLLQRLQEWVMVACCGAANWDRGRKVYQRYLACCDDIQNAFNQAPDIMLPMHMLYILLALQCGESKIAHDVLADLVDEYEDIDWLLQDATRWNDFVEDHLEAIMYMVDQVSNIDSDPRELISLYTAISFLPTQLVDFESPLWQTLYDAYERVTGRTVINRYSNDSYMGKRESAHMSPVEVAKGGALRGNPVYDNIRFGAQITLSQAGLYTVDDFKTITKQEVLMLPGIGKKTVEQLEHNGVIFKA